MAGERLEPGLVSRHVEPQHGRRRQRLPRRGEVAGFLLRGTVGHPHDHRQAEAVAEVAAAEPLVAGLGLRLDRGDAFRGHGQRLRLVGHEDWPALGSDPEAAVAEPAVPSCGLEKAGEGIGVGVRGVDQEFPVSRAGPDRIPRLLAGHVVAVDRVPVAVLEHLARDGEVFTGQPQVPLARLASLAAGIGGWGEFRRRGSSVRTPGDDQHDREARDQHRPSCRCTAAPHPVAPILTDPLPYRLRTATEARFQAATGKLPPSFQAREGPSFREAACGGFRDRTTRRLLCKLRLDWLSFVEPLVPQLAERCDAANPRPTR